MADRKKILLPRSDIPGRAPTVNEIDFGEIAINTHDGKAYIKRQADGEITIESIGSEEVDNVYYVSKSGQYGNDGRSLMNAFKTLDSAVGVVTARQGFKFDEVTCERDLHLIMDAVRYDMILDTNFNTVTAGLSYKRGNAAKVTGEQKYQTRRSINEERVGMISNPLVVANQTANDRIVKGFSEIIDIFYDGEADDLYFTDPPVEAQTDANAAATIIQQNKAAIQDAILSYIATQANYPISYDAGTCSRDIGYILDAVATDLILGTNHNTETAGNSYLRNASAYVLSDQNTATIAAVNYAKTLVKAIAGITSTSTIDTLFGTIVQYISGDTTAYSIPTYPTDVQSLYQTADRATATTNLQASRATIISDLTAWINAQIVGNIAPFTTGFVYDVAKCEEDVGYIVDALSHDIKYGGNFASSIAGRAYYVGAVIGGTNTDLNTGTGEKAATLAAYEELKTIINSYVLTAPEQTRATDLIEGIRVTIDTGVIVDNTQADLPDFGGLDTTEFDAIAAERQDIQQQVVDYVNETFIPQYPNFDQDLCYRDVGLILDAVARDLALDTNYSTITAGFAYKRANSAYVLSDQKEITIAAVNFVRKKVKALAGVVVSDATIDTLFDRITDVLEGRVTEYEIPSYPSTVGVAYQTAARENAQVALTTNRQTLSDQLTTWINDNYIDLTYDQDKCARDVLYIVDALAHDIKYGGNTGTRTNARAYFSKGVDQLGAGEQAATVAAYEQLKTFINAFVTTQQEQDDIAVLIDIIRQVITDGNLDNLAAEVEPFITGSATEADANAIFTAKLSIQDQTIVYANDRFFNPAYDQALCFRDVGLILDAVKRDLILGTDYNAHTAGNAYQRTNSAYVLSDQNQVTIDAIEFARDQLLTLGFGGAVNTQITNSIATVVSYISGTPVYPSLNYPTTAGSTYQTADRITAATELQNNRTNIQDDVDNYIAANFTLPNYDAAKCRRDVGYIIDALTHDVKYGGNTGTRKNALAYFSGTVNKLGNDADEIAATIASYEQLKTIVATYVTTAPEQTVLSNLLDIIIAPLQADDDDVVVAEVEIELGGLTTTNFDAITDNTLAIQNDTIDFVNDSNPVGGFDDEKCARDTQLIIDAVALDLELNTNFNSITAGNSYRRQAANKVGSDQLTYTIQSIEYLRDLINSLGLSADSQTFVTARIKEITELLEESSDYGKTDGDPINFTGSAAIDFDKRQASIALQSNRRKIQTRVVAFIEENYDTLAYDQDACVRDLGYIVDALSHDILFDVDYGTETTARSYWSGIDLYGPDQNLDGEADVWTKQLGDGETVATAAAYAELKTIIADYVTTATEQTRINGLIDVIIASINASDPLSIPNTALVFTGDSLTISGQRATLTEQTVGYANQIFPAYQFDQATCRRDMEFVLDALTYDIKYGGNSATSIAQRAYFSIFNNGYVDLLGQNELNATITAYTRMKNELSYWLASLDTDVQGKALSLLDIIIEAVTQSSAGTYQLGTFFNDPVTRNQIYQYNYPTGLRTQVGATASAFDFNYGVQTFPNLIDLGYKVVFNDLYNVHVSFDVDSPQRLTIIRSSSAVASNQGTDSTIYLKSGDYVVNNPIALPPKTAIIGDALRSTTIRPKNVDSDIFWADNGVYIKEITFRDHQNGAACLAFDPRNDTTTGPFITQSPYVQNCTSLTSSGIGLKIDGSKVSGLRSMVLDAFTQFNAGGIGVHLLNRGYAQLVSLFTVSTTTSVLATSGGQCSLTNSNSSFGERGLVATGGSPSLYNGTLHANYLLNDDEIRINSIITQDAADYTLNVGDFKKPNYNDAIKFDNDNYYYTVVDVSDEITQDWGITGNTAETEQTAINGTTLNSLYGHSVVISENDLYAVVTERDGGAGSGGRAEVYVKDFVGGVPVWGYQAQLAPTPDFGSINPTDDFGERVAISADGSYCVISAPGHQQVDAQSSSRLNGVVYAFRRTNETWTQDAFIEIGRVQNRDRKFGSRIALSQDALTLFVSDYEDDGQGAQGVVYAFTRPNTASSTWTQIQRIVCPDGATAAVDLPVPTTNPDGTDLLVHWQGQVNKVFYYQRNIDNQYILAQIIVPKSNFEGTRLGELDLNSETSHFVFGNSTTPRGYYTNTFTDADNSPPTEIIRKQKLDNVVFSGNTITTTDPDADFTIDFPADTEIQIRGSASNDGLRTITGRTATTLTVSGAAFAGETTVDVEIFVEDVGVAELFVFEEGNWITQDIIEAPYDKFAGFGFGSNVDMDIEGLLVAVGNTPTNNAIENEVSILERARSDWNRVTVLEPQTPTNVATQGDNDKYGSGGHAVSVGGSGDYVLVGAGQRRTNVSDANTEFGAAFFYYSILEETGSYNVTIAPPLNVNMSAGDNASFHQRSLITASGHTFEYVGSGTNMFTAIPQNGGIPKKENEVLFDSAEAATPNFGLVYFTATDELGDFRIGENLTINREEGTITGITFDRSLFAVLTPFILAIEGGN